VIALWQGGGNLGAYLGLLTSPSGMSSANMFRLDSWWIEKRWLDEPLTARLGQFAGQDFFGAQHYATSFIFEPMGYSFGNLFTDFESFDTPSTPAFELRVVPIHNLYVKSMVLAGDSSPFSHNPTGLVPQFRGDPVSVSEIGFTPRQEGVVGSGIAVRRISVPRAASSGEMDTCAGRALRFVNPEQPRYHSKNTVRAIQVR
jgi:porin